MVKRNSDGEWVPKRRGYNLYSVSFVRRKDGRNTSNIVEARSEAHAMRQIGRTATAARMFRAGQPPTRRVRLARFLGAATLWFVKGAWRRAVKGIRAWWTWARDKEARPYEH